MARGPSGRRRPMHGSRLDRQQQLMAIAGWFQVAVAASLILGAIVLLVAPRDAYATSGDRYALALFASIVFALATLPVARTVALGVYAPGWLKPMAWLGLLGLMLYDLYDDGVFNLGYAGAALAWGASLALLMYMRQQQQNSTIGRSDNL